MFKSPKIILLAMCFPAVLTAMTADGRESSVLPTVEVWGKRPMKDIGVQQTKFDSIALKENVALSMADILTFNSPLYVKNYGRATMSTVSMRGTSPTHTQVSWNGLKINNPMLGLTDFSTIPSFFVDNASLLHGTSAINETSGALGGMVRLSSSPVTADSTMLHLQYVQGIGSFNTFDEFARFDFTDGKWALSTRVSYASSPNDYKYINRDKKVNVYDDDHNIISQDNPTERNRSGAYHDLNVLQEVSYTFNQGDRLGVDAWYSLSDRHLPMLTTDYGDEREFVNKQKDINLRAVASWNMSRTKWSLNAAAGYIHSLLRYNYSRELAQNNWAVMSDTRNVINTFMIKTDAFWYPSSKWVLSASLSSNSHIVKSTDKGVVMSDGNRLTIGFDKKRNEFSAALSARWQPLERLGLAAVLRQEIFGKHTATIPAFFTDFLILRPVNLILKGSVSKNYKFPSLNDLFFLPGGNPDLLPEHGISYDAGLSAERSNVSGWLNDISLSATWFESYINNWILWLPTTKGYFSPRNAKKVHSYGIETSVAANFQASKNVLISLNANYSWTPSINVGEPMSENDKSVGKQLPYVPRHSASVTGRLAWKTWAFTYKWAYYSTRFTMSSNEDTISGSLKPYFMSNIVVQKDFFFTPVDMQFKLAVNNLFNEEYISVLSHPMPGINFEFFIALTPKFL